MCVFDEATSALDLQTERDVMASLNDLSQSRTCLIIAHRLATVAQADNILVLDKGEIKEAGPHNELLGLRGKYFDMWKAQQGSH